jgi:hypothetical protein
LPFIAVHGSFERPGKFTVFPRESKHNALPSQDKRTSEIFTLIFILVSWAHFRRAAPETGLSASIPRLSRGESLRDFRFYPLRVLQDNLYFQIR